MTDLFFPNGNSTFGSLKQMNVKMGSFKGDFIQQLPERLDTPEQIMQNKTIFDDEEDFK